MGLLVEMAAKDIQVTLVWMGILDTQDKWDLMVSLDIQEMKAVQELRGQRVNKGDLLAVLDDASFRERFRRSPVKRAKRRGLVRNVAVALGNAGETGHRPLLERLAGDDDPVVREHAAWALRRLDERLSPGAGSS